MRIGIDFDDVIAALNARAVELANKENSFMPPLQVSEITSWELPGRTKVLMDYYRREEVYDRQLEELLQDEATLTAVRKLMKLGDVYFCSAPFPEFMTKRAEQIKTAFPEVSDRQIVLGAAKDLMQFDFLLDDNLHNIETTPAKYPVLFRQPWNQSATGVLSVTSLEAFYTLVFDIMWKPLSERSVKIPSVICLVAPSGSGKYAVADLLNGADKKYQFVPSYTTKCNISSAPGTYLAHIPVTDEAFDGLIREKKLAEWTVYAGYRYGVDAETVRKLLSAGKYPVVPIDICGALGMAANFPTVIIYLDTPREQRIACVIDDPDLDTAEKTHRITAMPAEEKNAALCDYVFPTETAAAYIVSLI